MNELPEGYIKGVPRVSNIVSFVFPFEGTDGQQRYLSWLKKVGVSEDLYLLEAQTVGTYIHKQMEDFILDQHLDSDSLSITHKDTIQHGKAYINELKERFKEKHIDWVPEPVVLDEQHRMQGSVDLVRINKEENKVYIYDYKTWGIAKEAFNLPNVYRKPYSKLKKVALQMSLYAEMYRQQGYEIGGIYAVWLHKSGCYEFPLELINKKEIDTILTEFAESQCKVVNSKEFTIEFNPTTNMYEVEILEPTVQYGNVKIKAEINGLEDGEKEAVENLIKKAKYIANEMKK